MGERRPAANGAGYGFKVEFAEPVHGPVAVGCGARRDGGFVGDEELNMFDREESLIT